MDRYPQQVLDNPLFSPTEESQEKCWDVQAEIVELKTKSPKNVSGMDSSLTSSNSPARQKRSPVKGDKESEVLAQFSMNMKIRRIMKEEKEEDEEMASYPASPVITQAGGVASNHPIYSPCGSGLRSKFVRPRVNLAEPNRRQGQHNLETQKDETKEDILSEVNGCSGNEGGEDNGETKNSESIEPIIQDSEPTEKTNSGNDISDKMEPESTPVTQNGTIGRTRFLGKNSGPFAMMIIMLCVFISASSTFGLVLLDNKCSSAYNGHHIDPSTSGLRSSYYANLSSTLGGSLINLDYVCGLTNSSKKVLRSAYVSSCSTLVYLRSCTSCILKQTCVKSISLIQNYVANLKILGHRIVFSTMVVAEELRGFCKCFAVNNNNMYVFPTQTEKETHMFNYSSKDVHGNSCTNQAYSTQSLHSIQDPYSKSIHAETKNITVEKNSTTETLDESSSSPSTQQDTEADQKQFSPEQTSVVVVMLSKSEPEAPSPKSGMGNKSMENIIWNHVKVLASLLVLGLALIVLGAIVSPCMWPLGSATCHEMKKRRPRIRQTQDRSPFSATLRESPATLGSFLEYVDLPHNGEGSRSKERKSTPTSAASPVRRSMRIRNKSLSPVTTPPFFTAPS